MNEANFLQVMPKATNPKFDAVIQKMVAIHAKKSQDYANDANRYSNFEAAATSAGTTVDVVFRTLIGVKLARLAELQGKGKTPNNESIEDSLLDLAVYATLYASYYEKATQGVAAPITQEELKRWQEQAAASKGFNPPNTGLYKG